MNRDKVNIILADAAVPTLKAERYMDRGPMENELKQASFGDLIISEKSETLTALRRWWVIHASR